MFVTSMAALTDLIDSAGSSFANRSLRSQLRQASSGFLRSRHARFSSGPSNQNANPKGREDVILKDYTCGKENAAGIE